MIERVFESTTSLKVWAAGLGVTVLVLLVALTALRMPDGPATEAAPDPASTDLFPVAPGPDATSPLPDYGSAAPVATEAVIAWLLGDLRALESLVEPEVMEAAAEAPAPSGRVTGEATVLLDGPTRQKVSVPTSDGDIVLDMVVVDRAWTVMNMRYAK